MPPEFKIVTSDPNATVFKDGVQMSTGTGGGPVIPPPTGVPFLPGLPPPREVLIYPTGSQLNRHPTTQGSTPFGFRFVIPTSGIRPGAVGVFKDAGFPGECRRDRLIGINGVVNSTWWADQGYSLGTYINESYYIGPGNYGSNTWLPGVTIDLYFRQPDGQGYQDVFELIAAR